MILENCPITILLVYITIQYTTIIVIIVQYMIISFQRKIRTHLDLLSIPQSGGGNVRTIRWDQRLQIQNLSIAFKRVPRWK